MFNSFFSFIFFPLIESFGIGGFVFFMSFFLTLIITLIYVNMTPQPRIKHLKQEIKELNKERSTHIGDKNVLEIINKELGRKNMEISSYSLRPTLLTIIPIFLIITWMWSSVAVIPLQENIPFKIYLFLDNTTNTYTVSSINTQGLSLLNSDSNNSLYQYTLQGSKGNYTPQWLIDNKIYNISLKITDRQEYTSSPKIIKDGIVNAIVIDYKEAKPFFGLGWFWEYLFFSILFNIILRKIMDVH